MTLTLEVVDGTTGEVRICQLFVAVLGAFNYTYAEATFTQRLVDWIGSHTRAFTFFDGVTAQIVSDNLRSGITKACFYEPAVNRTYAEMAAHYGTAVIPARPRKPRDKTSVSYCTSFGLSRGDTVEPCWTRAATTTALDNLQVGRDVPKPTSKAV
jgi:transposase